ncbi:DUF6146 family protein [Mesonia aquimarina]|uniref:DUF6146 family protein n=1 Tax=Mesonia aquimarina TaxID=1504967 RepID=UPI000EF5A49D|nr:DUF6146 family protein [Mesonia aquimarina]
MRYILSILAVCFLLCNCASSKKTPNNFSKKTNNKEDTLRIANDSLEYEVIIIENGFNAWLATQPPRRHYSQTYLELKNRRYVQEYNVRVNSPSYDKSLYPLIIDYSPQIDYGYEVNYLLYNYFVFFEEKYNQKLR